jgi:hypothetical protein
MQNEHMVDRTQVRGEKGVCDAAAVIAALSGTYERGWQPADLLHITRRSLGAAEVRLAVWAILYEARISRAIDRAPRAWCDQLVQIAQLTGVDRADAAGPIHRTALTVLWRHLPRLPAECPSPSQWPRGRGDYDAVRRHEAEPKVANRIRGALAKAERSEFAEEAETFTAKAQELITRHGVEVASQQTRRYGVPGVEVRSRRIHLDNPYLKEKAQLLSEIGRCNGVRTVWFSKLGMATTIGTPLALDQVELMYHSLLLQATHAMNEAGKQRTSPASTAFRRTFLYGFAVRVGQRIQEQSRKTEEEAAGMDLASYERWKERLEAALDARLAELFCASKGRQSWWDEDKRSIADEFAVAG